MCGETLCSNVCRAITIYSEATWNTSLEHNCNYLLSGILHELIGKL